MPVEENNVLDITCDQCGGHGELDPTKREGWLFVTHEVYGLPSEQHVFCCFAHASEKAATIPEVDRSAKVQPDLGPKDPDGN